ncbi:hypothetical protein ACWDLG_44600 [Nonomuraea sp. NPDC003727]
MHGELTTLGIAIAPSTVWEILKQEGLDPAPERASTTWADLLRPQSDALLACDFPAGAWTAQHARHRVMPHSHISEHRPTPSRHMRWKC